MNGISSQAAVKFQEDAIPPPADAFQGKAYGKVLEKLNQASITKFYNAFTDIPWDDPDYQILKTDARWELPASDALGGSSWYAALPQPERIALALERTAERVKIGVVFESILVRGMLEFASNLPNRSSEYRYAMHECIEEMQHSLMFQEFVNRSGYDPAGLTGAMNLLARYIVKQGKHFPELFFIFVLGGEGPIDFEQRQQLKHQANLHPLMKRMVQIHITEEARHICFANEYLREYVPKLGRWKRLKLSLLAPLILGNMGKLFLHPPHQLIQKYQIPAATIAESYTDNPKQKIGLQQSMAAVSKLCQELGVLRKSTAGIWRKYGLIAE